MNVSYRSFIEEATENMAPRHACRPLTRLQCSQLGTLVNKNHSLLFHLLLPPHHRGNQHSRAHELTEGMCSCLAIRVRMLVQLPVKWAGTTSAALRCPVLLTQAGTGLATERMPVILKYSSHSPLHERAHT